jgi:hypothetical protein
MASDVLSLFGMNPNVLQQQRVQNAVDQAGRMSADYAIGSAGGQMLGAGINSAFGLQTPEMEQASSVREGLAGGDLGSVEGLRAAARKLMLNGDYAQAMALHQEANNQEALKVKAAKKKVTNLATYVLPDGSEVIGGLYGEVPSYRVGEEWVPLPDGSLRKDTSAINTTPTGVNVGQAKTVLDKLNVTGFGGLSPADAQLLAVRVASEAKQIAGASGGDITYAEALQQAAENLVAAYVNRGIWSDDLNLPKTESGLVVREHNGQKWLVNPNDPTVPPVLVTE